VFDRFHIMQLMNEKLDELRQALMREASGLRACRTFCEASFL
jgi:transposase